MHDPKTYRDRAAHALSKARDVKLPELRTTFEALAAGYEALANDAERLGRDAGAGEVEVRCKTP